MKNVINRQGLGLVIGLAVQYVLGMAINLFVEFPSGGTPETQWQFTIRSPLVLLHLIIGTLLVTGAIALVMRVSKQRAALWKWPAVSGLFWVVTAWAAGDTFVSSQAEMLSYLMSVAFLLAILSYMWGLYRARRVSSDAQ